MQIIGHRVADAARACLYTHHLRFLQPPAGNIIVFASVLLRKILTWRDHANLWPMRVRRTEPMMACGAGAPLL
jgi:hypothetical protein